jgi:tRNA-specific 2-thiouridylase
VVALDVGRNQVVVGDRAAVHHPGCIVQRVNWVSVPPIQTPQRVSVQIRYRSPAVAATVIPLTAGDANPGDRVKLVFDDPQFGVTPGQAAVWYDGDVVLGGGIIEPLQAPDPATSSVTSRTGGAQPRSS